MPMRPTSKNGQTVIWDWNGTLLNDMDICISCMNQLLRERGYPRLDRQRYREIFTFPVKEYYELAGFDFRHEPFEIPAHQFIDLYRNELETATLHQGAARVLEEMAVIGFRQAILSVMEQELLLDTVNRQDVSKYFQVIRGIHDHLAHSKTELGKELLEDLDGDRSGMVMVGDTLHDFEVANEMGIRCILISHGHQSAGRLKKAGCPVVDNYIQLKDILTTYF